MKILKRLENIFSAAAFAEAGEHETARQILREDVAQDKAKREETGADRAKKHERANPTPSRA